MKYSVCRYKNGMLTAGPCNPARVAEHLAKPTSDGAVDIEAVNEWEAMELAKPRFASGDYTKPPRKDGAS